MTGVAVSIGTALGHVAARLDGWLSQRDLIAKELSNVIDRARGMLSQLGTLEVPLPGRRGRPAASTAAVPEAGRKRRKMSAKARKAIGDAQRARWAKLKGKAKKAKKPGGQDVGNG